MRTSAVVTILYFAAEVALSVALPLPAFKVEHARGGQNRRPAHRDRYHPYGGFQHYTPPGQPSHSPGSPSHPPGPPSHSTGPPPDQLNFEHYRPPGSSSDQHVSPPPESLDHLAFMTTLHYPPTLVPEPEKFVTTVYNLPPRPPTPPKPPPLPKPLKFKTPTVYNPPRIPSPQPQPQPSSLTFVTYDPHGPPSH